MFVKRVVDDENAAAVDSYVVMVESEAVQTPAGLVVSAV